MGGLLSQYSHVATEEPSGWGAEAGGAARQTRQAPAASGQGARPLPPEAARWQCGEQRLQLRQEANVPEIDALERLASFDACEAASPGGDDHAVDSRRWVLEPEELRQLLKGFDGSAPSKEELDFVTTAADIVFGCYATQDQVLFALRTWFAFNRLPRSAGAVLGEAFPREGPMPAPESLRHVLLLLNEFQPVRREEATFVSEAAVRLGAAQGSATPLQLRQAIAAWYLHIERDETCQSELLKRSARDLHHGVEAWRALTSLLHGETPDGLSPWVGKALAGGLLALVCALRLAEIGVGSAPGAPECERPGLGGLLRATGILGLLQALALASAVATNAYKVETCRAFAWTVAVVLTIVLVPAEVYGASQVLASSGRRCGFLVWQTCHFAYITLPTVIVALIGCGLPCLYACLGLHAATWRRSLDRRLLLPRST